MYVSSPESWTAPHEPARVVRFGWDHAVGDGLGERLAKERREHLVVPAVGLDAPAGAVPVAVGLRVGRDAVEEPGLVDTGEVEHDRDGHHLFPGREVGRRAGSMGDVGIAGGVDHAAREDRLATGLGLGDDRR